MQPLPIHLPSGNLIADRRFEWARDLEAKGDLAGAADLLTQALELAPGYASAWFALGEVREKLGDRDGAIAAFREAAQADRQDRHGATLHLIRLGARPPAAMPEGYVRALFDGYAPAFDRALTEGLGYRAPELLLRAVQAAHPGTPMKFGSVLDLGCGTGLAGAAFRPFCDWLVGVDLSPAMLAQARTKGLYDRLIEGEVLGFLADEAQRQGALSSHPRRRRVHVSRRPCAGAESGSRSAGAIRLDRVQRGDPRRRWRNLTRDLALCSRRGACARRAGRRRGSHSSASIPPRLAPKKA